MEGTSNPPHQVAFAMLRQIGPLVHPVGRAHHRRHRCLHGRETALKAHGDALFAGSRVREGDSMKHMAVAVRVAAAVLTLALFGAPASAQKVPSATVQEILIKASLLTFNDANVTGNYE